MSNPTVRLLGFPPSTFYQTAALALAEKGVLFETDMPALAEPDYAKIHPWRRVPVLVHGEVSIFETLAIAIYADAKFEGPALQPLDIMARAKMFQWISAFLDYGVNSILQFSVRERFQKALRNQTPDEAIVEQHRPAMNYFCAQMNSQLSSAFISGSSMSIADLFLIPVMIYFANTPEGREILANNSNVARWLDSVRGRPSVMTICQQVDWTM
ncbi:glutathione S-transferase [Tardiphaga sp. OK246]|jgi:glutathione S-transferase|uniref:glutathione S-transferase family protein n=1 Tax=Tardiphaga sp. OK246 TaxID=1855307 RepID=UPI000B740FCE|nr:glutathione S-transferase family protein [Tardiphaga sp. OK246]SNS46034.1 glutathione S-transferase [Tardiphaga sp. OK246]